MNFEQIKNIPAGRKLDAIVFKHIYKGQSEEFDFSDVEGYDYPDNCLYEYSTDNNLALKIFIDYCDPNRISIHPVGNGGTGLFWMIYYDDEVIVEDRTLAGAMVKMALKFQLEQDEYEKQNEV
jgi:hypothetical protein